MIDLGTVRPGTTIYVPFQTYDSNDPQASVTITGLATTDLEIYKDGSVTQRASDSGYALLDTDGIDFDTTTGIHGVSINLADNTTAGFYAAGSQYWVVIASITVDAATINFIPVTFRIGYPDAIINTTIATLSTQTSFTLTSGPAEDDALNGCVVVIHDVASAVQLGFGVISDYTGSTKTVTLSSGVTFTAAATDNISIFPPGNINWIQSTAQTAGDVYSDTTIISSQTTVIESDSIIIESSVQAVETDTGNIYSDTAIIYSDTTAIHSQTTVIESDSIIIESSIQAVEVDTSTTLSAQITTIASDVVQVYSDTTIISSQTTVIESDSIIIESSVQAIEAAGGSLTAAQDSKLTKVTSDVVIVVSDTTAIHSQTTVIESDSIVIESSVQAVEVDTSTTLSAQVTTIASDLVIVGSDVAAIHSQTTVIESDSITIQSSLVVVESQTTVIESNTEAIHSQTTVIESDTAVIEAAAPASRVAVAVTFTGGTTTTAVLGNVNGSAASSVDDYYNGRLLLFDSGTLANQVTDITDYTGSTKTATITAVTTAVTSGHTAVML